MSDLEPIVPPELFRTCVACEREKPFTAFPRAPGGKGRIYKCAACVAGYDPRAIRKKKAEEKQTLRLLVTALRGKSINAPHISELTEQAVVLFGGVEGLAIAWKQQIDEAIKVRPGSKTVLDAFYSIAKLIQLSTENRHTAPDLEGMSDEDIAAELLYMMRKVIPIESLGDAREHHEHNDAANSN